MSQVLHITVSKSPSFSGIPISQQLIKAVQKVFAGKDASRALAQSSLKPEEARPDWQDLSDEHKKVLADWFTFFSKRYNIVGKVEGATNQ